MYFVELPVIPEQVATSGLSISFFVHALTCEFLSHVFVRSRTDFDSLSELKYFYQYLVHLPSDKQLVFLSSTLNKLTPEEQLFVMPTSVTHHLTQGPLAKSDKLFFSEFSHPRQPRCLCW